MAPAYILDLKAISLDDLPTSIALHYLQQRFEIKKTGVGSR